MKLWLWRVAVGCILPPAQVYCVDRVMRIEYEISEQDFLDGQTLAIRRHPSLFTRWCGRIVFAFGAFFALSWIAILLVRGAAEALSPDALLFLLLIVYLLLTPLFTRLWRKRIYAKSGALHGLHMVEISGEGVKEKGPTGSSEYTWAAFDKFAEDEKCFVVFQPTLVFHIVPKRGLSQEQIAEFREYVRRNLSPAP